MVETATLSERDGLARKHPIAAFSLDALTAGAAKLRPGRVALIEAGAGRPAREVSYGEFDRQVRAVAQRLAELALAPGERILILTSASTACVIAPIAALAAGVEPLLVRIGFGAAELAAIAAAANCTTILGPSSYGDMDLEEVLFEAAARSETIRIVATLGPDGADGAIDLAPERLSLSDAKLPVDSHNRPRIGTLDAQSHPIFHEQGVLLAAALDLVGKAEIAAGSHLLSTLVPASFASLVTGPIASLLSGAPLTVFGPFEAASLLASLNDIGPNHCVIPAAILPDFERAGLLRNDVLASAIAVVRDEGAIAVGGDCPLVEVRATGEGAVRIERRARANSKPAPILSGEVLAPVPPVQQAERSWR